MKKSAVIFSYKRQRVAKFIFKSFAIGGILGVLVLFSPLVFVEAKYRVEKILPQKQKVVVAESSIAIPQSFKTPTTTFGDLAKEKKVEILTPVDPAFSLIIPKINVNSRIVANVSASDKNEYDLALKSGIAHAKGTYLPGGGGTIYLFAHSTDYIWNINRFNAVFYLAKELDTGDEIDIFYNGRHFVYTVDQSKIVDADEVSYLKPQRNQEELILQTCYPPGTTWKRLLVFAHAKVENNLLSYSP